MKVAREMKAWNTKLLIKKMIKKKENNIMAERINRTYGLPNQTFQLTGNAQ